MLRARDSEREEGKKGWRGGRDKEEIKGGKRAEGLISIHKIVLLCPAASAMGIGSGAAALNVRQRP